MITVYVESNFVLEQALEQEQSDACGEILSLAHARKIILVIPAFSLAEPHQALALKQKARSRLTNELRAHITELGRSRSYRGIPADFTALAAVLIRSAGQERDGLQRAITGLLNSSEVVPLDSDILASATDLEVTLAISGQDAIVLASVLRHLQQTAPA